MEGYGWEDAGGAGCGKFASAGFCGFYAATWAPAASPALPGCCCGCCGAVEGGGLWWGWGVDVEDVHLARGDSCLPDLKLDLCWEEGEEWEACCSAG